MTTQGRRLRFYTTPSGNQVALEDLRDLPPDARAKLAAHLEDLCKPDTTLVPKPIGHGLHEVKTRIGKLAPRALIAYDSDSDGQLVIVLLCLLKKSTKLEKKDLDLAKSRLASYKQARTDDR